MTELFGLEIPEIPYNQNSIIERYADYINGGNGFEGVTDSPREYQYGASIFLISTFMKRNFSISSVPEMNPFPHRNPLSSDFFGAVDLSNFYMNTFFIIMGPSRLARKSITCSYVENILMSVNPEIMMPQDFTPQSLVSGLVKKFTQWDDGRPPITQAVIMHDEVSVFFDRLAKQKHMASTDALLSRIYDCRDYAYSTIERGREAIRNPYVTIFWGSTEFLPSLFQKDSMRQGFLNRFVYIIPDEYETRQRRMMTSPEEQVEGYKLISWFRKLNSIVVKSQFLLDDRAEVLVNEFDKKVEEKIREGTLGDKAGYWGNLPNLLLKIAAIYEVSLMTTQKLSEVSSLRGISYESVVWALYFVYNVWGWFNKMASLMTRRLNPREEGSDEILINLVEDIVREFPGIRKGDLLMKAKITARRINPIIETLMTAGRIDETRVQTKGRPSLQYKMSKGNE